MSFEQGTQIEPLATCIRGIERTGIQPGDTVMVIGAGVTGLMNMQLANIYGAGKIFMTDFAPFRLEMARQLGADQAINAQDNVLSIIEDLNEGRKADVVIVTAGSIKAMEQGMSLAGGGSTVLLFAPSSPEAMLPVSPFQLLFSEITLVSTYSCSHVETRQALKLIHGGRVNVDELVTHRFDLTGVRDAIDLAVEAGESMKILITP
jgi:L-iditol 2-dehydrogenase